MAAPIRFRYVILGGAALIMAASCGGGRVSNGFLRLELTQPGTEASVEIPIVSCYPGWFHASGDSWEVGLDEEQGGARVEVSVLTPEGRRMVGSMFDSDGLIPDYGGSGSASLLSEGDPAALATTAEFSWLCGL